MSGDANCNPNACPCGKPPVSQVRPEAEPLFFGKLRRANVERCIDAFHDVESWSPTDWACAAAGELGEACNLIKKIRRGDLDPSDPKVLEDLGDELADVVIYLDLLAARCGIDLGEAVTRKFNAVSARRGSSVTI